MGTIQDFIKILLHKHECKNICELVVDNLIGQMRTLPIITNPLCHLNNEEAFNFLA